MNIHLCNGTMLGAVKSKLYAPPIVLFETCKKYENTTQRKKRKSDKKKNPAWTRSREIRLRLDYIYSAFNQKRRIFNLRSVAFAELLMQNTFITIRIFFLTLVTITISHTLSADLLILHNKERIKGYIVFQDQHSVKIKTTLGTFTIKKSEIKQISKNIYFFLKELFRLTCQQQRK